MFPKYACDPIRDLKEEQPIKNGFRDHSDSESKDINEVLTGEIR